MKSYLESKSEWEGSSLEMEFITAAKARPTYSSMFKAKSFQESPAVESFFLTKSDIWAGLD